MNITQLKTFVTIVDTGSFSDAAKALRLSQPAVTMQIQNLEGDIGESLLDRRYRRIDLTDAGRILLPYARKMLEEAETARMMISSQSGSVCGTLTIAASTTPGDYIIPRLLGEFKARYPEVNVRLEVESTSAVADRLESALADVGVIGAPVKGRKLECQPVGKDEIIVICSPKSPLASKHVRLADLASEKWVMRASDSGTQQIIGEYCASHGLSVELLDVVVELGTGEAIINAVEGGLGVAMISRYVAEKALKLGTVVQIDVEEFVLTRSFYVATPHRLLSCCADAFVSFIVEKMATN